MDSEYKGVTAEDNLDEVSVVKFTIFVDNEEWDVVPAGILSEARGDFMDAAVRHCLCGPEIVVIEGFPCCGGDMWRLHALDGRKRDLVVLDGIPDERARCVGTRGDIP